MDIVGLLIMVLGFLMITLFPNMSEKDEKYYAGVAIFCMISGLITMVIGFAV